MDILCHSDDGFHFIVEPQKTSQKHFMDRTVFYASKLLSEQDGLKGEDWDYELSPTYVVSIINFDLQEDPGEDPVACR